MFIDAIPLPLVDRRLVDVAGAAAEAAARRLTRHDGENSGRFRKSRAQKVSRHRYRATLTRLLN